MQYNILPSLGEVILLKCDHNGLPDEQETEIIQHHLKESKFIDN
jgi:hypothetical protein